MKKILSIITTVAIVFTIISCNFFGNQEDAQAAFEKAEQELMVSSLEQTEEIQSLMTTIKDSAMANPAVYASAFNHSNEFHNKTARLLAELQQVRDLIEEQVGETGDYAEWDTDTDVLFFNNDAYSENGERFIKAIKDYKLTSSDQLFFFPEAEKMAAASLNIEDVQNREGATMDWLTYHFKGFPAIASKTKIAQMERDIKNVEVTFLKALIEKPQF